MKARQFFLALATTVLVAGCGGGDEAALSPQKFAAAQRADVQAAATVTPAQAAEQLLEAAQATYPGLFPAGATTQSFGPFAFRYYASTNMYLGVAIIDGLGYTKNGVYVVGTGFGTLANPAYQGTVTQFLPSLVIDSGLGGNKTLTITVTAAGTSYTIDVGSVPAPTAEGEFCSGLANDTTFTQIGAGAGGSLTINSCSFNGTSGTIAATLSITGPVSITFPYTISYTYH